MTAGNSAPRNSYLDKMSTSAENSFGIRLRIPSWLSAARGHFAEGWYWRGTVWSLVQNPYVAFKRLFFRKRLTGGISTCYDCRVKETTVNFEAPERGHAGIGKNWKFCAGTRTGPKLPLPWSGDWQRMEIGLCLSRVETQYKAGGAESMERTREDAYGAMDRALGTGGRDRR